MGMCGASGPGAPDQSDPDDHGTKQPTPVERLLHGCSFPRPPFHPHREVGVLGHRRSWARGDAPLGVRAEPPPVPVSLPAGERPGAEPGLGTGYLVLIAVAVFALVAGAGALVLVHYQRMTGRYSFGAAAGGVSYQAFYE